MIGRHGKAGPVPHIWLVRLAQCPRRALISSRYIPSKTPPSPLSGSCPPSSVLAVMICNRSETGAWQTCARGDQSMPSSRRTLTSLTGLFAGKTTRRVENEKLRRPSRKSKRLEEIREKLALKGGEKEQKCPSRHSGSVEEAVCKRHSRLMLR